MFDVLGFARRVDMASDSELQHEILTGQISELLGGDETSRKHGALRTIVFADTIVVFAAGSDACDYPWFLMYCQELATRSIRIRLPLRGAISVGVVHVAAEHPMVLGRPFLEAHSYCEGQQWIGLVMTPSATRELRQHGLDPLNHDFVRCDVPLKPGLKAADVVAYRFENGASNWESWLIPLLEEMQQQAPPDAKDKYQRAVEHIRRHHQWIASQDP